DQVNDRYLFLEYYAEYDRYERELKGNHDPFTEDFLFNRDYLVNANNKNASIEAMGIVIFDANLYREFPGTFRYTDVPTDGQIHGEIDYEQGFSDENQEIGGYYGGV